MSVPLHGSERGDSLVPRGSEQVCDWDRFRDCDVLPAHEWDVNRERDLDWELAR